MDRNGKIPCQLASLHNNREEYDTYQRVCEPQQTQCQPERVGKLNGLPREQPLHHLKLISGNFSPSIEQNTRRSVIEHLQQDNLQRYLPWGHGVLLKYLRGPQLPRYPQVSPEIYHPYCSLCFSIQFLKSH